MPVRLALSIHRIRIDPITVSIVVYREVWFQMTGYELHPLLHGIVILLQRPAIAVEIMLELR